MIHVLANVYANVAGMVQIVIHLVGTINTVSTATRIVLRVFMVMVRVKHNLVPACVQLDGEDPVVTGLVQMESGASIVPINVNVEMEQSVIQKQGSVYAYQDGEVETALNRVLLETLATIVFKLATVVIIYHVEEMMDSVNVYQDGWVLAVRKHAQRDTLAASA